MFLRKFGWLRAKFERSRRRSVKDKKELCRTPSLFTLSAISLSVSPLLSHRVFVSRAFVLAFPAWPMKQREQKTKIDIPVDRIAMLRRSYGIHGKSIDDAALWPAQISFDPSWKLNKTRTMVTLHLRSQSARSCAKNSPAIGGARRVAEDKRRRNIHCGERESSERN